MNSENAIWLSFDVEATGPCPGIHAMLSIGVVAFVRDPQSREWRNLGTFTGNFQVPEDLVWDEDTAKWWEQWPEAYSAHRGGHFGPSDPHDVMEGLCAWLEEIRAGEPDWKPLTWVAYPAAFDMPFVNYYAHRFAPESWHKLAKDDVMQRVACFDIGSAAAVLLGIAPLDVGKSRMPDHWKAYENKTPHVALADAKEQAAMIKAILDDLEQEPGEVDSDGQDNNAGHAAHCCPTHGCKYESGFDEPSCPVVLGLIEREPHAGWCQEPELVDDPEACRREDGT